MNIQPTDRVLHLSFDDEPYERADVFSGLFKKRQISEKTYHELETSVKKLPFEDKEFDVVYSVNVLGYMDNPASILKEIQRISKRAHIKEHSEFAEIIFGWSQTKWIINIENNQLIVKSKGTKFNRFGPFFHSLYANDPTFFEFCSKNPGLLVISVDWSETDQKAGNNSDGMFENVVSSDITVFRPCQTEYFDNSRMILGTVMDKIDVRHLKNNDLN